MTDDRARAPHSAELFGLLAEGHTIPCPWDGTTDGLGAGIDDMIIAAFETLDDTQRPMALCALAAEIRPRFKARVWPTGFSTS